METAQSLTSLLEKKGVLGDEGILSAFTKIDRKLFVPEGLQSLAYVDIPLPIGHGQTISQPFTVLFMLGLLDARRGDTVLDVGSGSAYTTALLAEIVGEEGTVTGVEIVPDLVALGKSNLHKFHFSNAEIRQSGDTIGFPEGAPYDRILVSAEAREVPGDLVTQLKVGGRMVIPVKNGIWNIVKHSDETIEVEKHNGFVFVPLLDSAPHSRKGDFE